MAGQSIAPSLSMLREVAFAGTPHPQGAIPTFMSPEAGELLCTQIAQRIRSAALGFTPIGTDDREELTAEAIAIAAGLLESVEIRGKTVTAGNLAYYAVKLVATGRRSTGRSTTDPMHAATQIAGRCQMQSLDEPLAGEADSEGPLCLHETLAAHTEDPAMAAMRRLDWEILVGKLDGATREVLCCLIDGRDLTTLVARLGRSRSSLQNDKHHLARLVRESLGPDALRVSQQLPQWRDDLVAERERVACRYERRAA